MTILGIAPDGMRSRSRTKVVVAGLGDTGMLVAIQLARRHRRFDVVGISSKPGVFSGKDLGLRLSDPGYWAHGFAIPFDRYRGLDRVRVIQGRLASLDPQGRIVTTELADGTSVNESFDVLVVATGTRTGFWRQPGLQTDAQVTESLRHNYEQVRAASSIAVVGGGPSGVGAAAHLAERFPDHDVSLYFPGARALTRHPPAAWDAARPRLEKLGVKLYPGHRAELPEDRHPPLAAGEVVFTTGQPPVKADLVLWATGIVTPNTSWLPSELLDPDGFVVVDQALRMPDLSDGWAVGDVAASDPLRSTSENFGAQLVARNVIAARRGRAVSSFAPPGHLWGSYLGGPMNDGLDLVTAKGRAFRVPRWFGERFLHNFMYERVMFRGIRPRAPRR